MITVDKGTEFESNVCQILYTTNPYSISHYDGGPDRGRDILLQYKIGTMIYDVIVECKCYAQSVNKENIMSSLDWAKIHRPALLYLWIKPYLTPSTKDYINLFCKEYGISVLFEEELNIEKYNEELEKEKSDILVNLKERIIDSLKNSNHTNLVELEYDNQIVYTDHYLADREWERNILMGNDYLAYYIQGVSACGKTQLLKNIAYVYNQNGENIFWHTIYDEESEWQISSFFFSLSHFFEIHYNDCNLKNYLQNHGFYLSNELISILMYLLKLFRPIIIIDNVHKCSFENMILKNTFETIITAKTNRIYFIGWFNIFPKTVNIKNNLRILVLEGLEEKDLDSIIIHHIGISRKDIAALIKNQYNGLPGYAILVDSQTNQNNLESNDTYLHGFIDYLSPSEKRVLFILTYASLPIEKKYFSKLNLLENLSQLVEKRLVENRGNSYHVHDKYKPFFKSYTLNNEDFQEIINDLTIISETEIDIVLDIISIYNEHKLLQNAYCFLEKSFPRLLHHQLIKKTLKLVQQMEEISTDNEYLIELCKMKIILLERLSQYDLCVQYLTIIEKDIDFCSLPWESIYYVQLRCFYFCDLYDKLLLSFYDNRKYIFEQMKEELRIQILLLIGRVYYIRGDLETSLTIYLLSYQFAISNNNTSLAVKTIHRIAMIECCKGLYPESKNTFLKIAELETLITPKRKSFAYYRIAKCCFALDELDESIDYLQKSISIKESYNDKRGIMYAYKLMANVYFKRHEFVDAIFYIEQAQNIAKELGLAKEVVAVNLTLVKNIMKYEINYKEINIEELLYDCLCIASNEKLLFRIDTIVRLSEGTYTDLHNESKKQYELTKQFLERSVLEQCDIYSKYLSKHIKNLFERLHNNNKAITSTLLIEAGIITSELKNLRINVDDL